MQIHGECGIEVEIATYSTQETLHQHHKARSTIF